jgi:hypothetical protein
VETSAAAPPPAAPPLAEPAPAPRRRLIGLSGLAGLTVATFALAAPGPELVPATAGGEPGWLLGPYGDGLGIGGGAYYGFLWLAFLSYLAVVLAAPALAARLVWGAIAVLVLAFALAPPLLSQDVFSYISYARLGAEHDLDPYSHVPMDVPSDPSLPYVGRSGPPSDFGWRDDVSAYGPLFTLGTYPLAALSVPAAMWTLKAVAALSVLGLAGVVARIAPARGLDARSAAAFVALNPLVLVHVVGGAHNDGLMMLLVLAGCAGVLALREAAGGTALVAAAAVKVSAAFAAPFAYLGAARRGRLLAAAAMSALAVAAASLLAFGSSAIDAVGLVGENQATTSRYSVPSTLSRIFGVGVDPVRVAALALYGVGFVWLLRRTWRGGDWLEAAGWAALGLLLASGWLLPWYLVWLLPFAALSRSAPLVGTTVALTAFQLVNRIPL